MHDHHVTSGEPLAIAAELVLLAVLAGGLGTWVVLRRLAFFAHAVGTATFPGLVIAGTAGGVGSALLAGAGVRSLRGLPRLGPDAGAGLVLALALAVGALVAGETDVHPEDLLFGELASVGWGEVGLTAGAVALALGADAVRGRRWLADALDGRGPDAVLLGCIALAAIAAVDAVGALLVAAVLVLPAATARLLARDLASMRAIAFALALGEGTVAYAISGALEADAGAVLAVVGGSVFALVAAVRR